VGPTVKKIGTEKCFGLGESKSGTFSNGHRFRYAIASAEVQGVTKFIVWKAIRMFRYFKESMASSSVIA
jgi:hypothetical protein